jgi:hypothetical protein
LLLTISKKPRATSIQHRASSSSLTFRSDLPILKMEANCGIKNLILLKIWKTPNRGGGSSRWVTAG